MRRDDALKRIAYGGFVVSGIEDDNTTPTVILHLLGGGKKFPSWWDFPF